jgi:hypothetical protein
MASNDSSDEGEIHEESVPAHAFDRIQPPRPAGTPQSVPAFGNEMPGTKRPRADDQQPPPPAKKPFLGLPAKPPGKLPKALANQAKKGLHTSIFAPPKGQIPPRTQPIAGDKLGEVGFNQWPAIVQGDSVAIGTFWRQSSAVTFWAKSWATNPTFGARIRQHNKLVEELRWDFNVLSSCTVQRFERGDGSSEAGELETLVNSLKLPDRDAFNIGAPQPSSVRHRFAVVKLTRGDQQHHVPAWSRIWPQADYKPRGPDGMNELCAPVQQPSFADNSEAKRAKDLCLQARELTFWVNVSDRDGQGEDVLERFVKIIRMKARA